MNDFDMCCACSPYGLLACKIVQQAIIDYRALMRGENRGEKVSQLVLLPIITPELEEVDDLDATERGNGGFGSTGAF